MAACCAHLTAPQSAMASVSPSFRRCCGAEFIGQVVDLRAYAHGVRMDFSRPGTPTDNAHIELFNGSLRDECLNVTWFASLEEARKLVEAWRRDYNESRPHMAQNGETPAEFARISGLCQSGQVQIAAEF